MSDRKLPKDIQRAVRRADKAAQAAGIKNAPKDEEEKVVAAEQEPAPDPKDAPAEEPREEPKDEPQNDPEPPVAVEQRIEPSEPQAEPPAEPSPEPAPRVDATNWEAKYRTLQGKYDVEIPRLTAEVEDLRAVLASLGDKKKDEPEPAPKTNGTKRLITDAERQDYGEDFIDVIYRAAQEAVQPTIDKLQEENKSLRNQLGGVTHKMAQDQQADVKAVLSREVKDWQSINRDERFHQWLNQEAPYSNELKGVLLRSAFDQGDAKKVVAFFKGFLEEHAVTQPAVEPELAPAEEPIMEPAAGAPKPDLATLAAPGKGKAVPNPNSAPKEGPIWTRAEISAFYSDVARGKFKGNEQKQAEYEKSIMRAQKENRIRD